MYIDVLSVHHSNISTQYDSKLRLAWWFHAVLRWFPKLRRNFTPCRKFMLCCSWVWTHNRRGRTDSSSLSMMHQNSFEHDQIQLFQLFHKMVSVNVWYVFLLRGFLPEIFLRLACREPDSPDASPQERLLVWLVVASWNGRWPVEIYWLQGIYKGYIGIWYVCTKRQVERSPITV